MKNVLSIFQRRVNDIFSRGGAGAPPIAFRRLAKRALREMENETFVIDGVDTAPALYTILVSADDDRAMRAFYVGITTEISSLIEAMAKRRGYSFVGKPLVRFMIDPSLRVGKYAIFAENIDPRTLTRLREEENAFLGIEPELVDAYDLSEPPEPEPTPEAAGPAAPSPADPEPPESAQTPEPVAIDGADAVPQAQEVATPEGSGSMADDEEEPEPYLEEEPSEAFDPSGAPSTPEVPMEETPAERPAPLPTNANPEPDTPPKTAPRPCSLIDQQTGKAFGITTSPTRIGRERAEGAIVLRDPNVSRRHAELTYDGSGWHIRDLGSTNGTLVNDIDIDDCALRDGDIITIGLLSFVFREG